MIVIGVVFLYQLLGLVSNSQKFKPGQLLQSQTQNDPEFDTSLVKFVPHETTLQNYKSRMIESPDGISWDKFAYVFYATSPDRLMSVLVNVHMLHQLSSQASIELIYTYQHPLSGYHNRHKAWEDTETHTLPKDAEAYDILDRLTKKYGVNVRYLPPLTNLKSKPGEYWSDSFSKFHLWKFVEYDRVIYLDADGFIKSNLDLLFLIPPSIIATPIEYTRSPHRAKTSKKSLADIPPTPLENSLLLRDIFYNLIMEEYDFDDKFYQKLYAALPDINTSLEIGQEFDDTWKMRLGSYLMVCKPNLEVWTWIKKSVPNLDANSWDMELVNEVWDLNGLIETSGNKFTLEDGKTIPSVLLLPHSPYAILSGEFRKTLHEHVNYLTDPIYFGLLGDFYFERISLRELEKKLHKQADNIEDSWGEFDQIGLWDWAWRFTKDSKVKRTTGDDSEDHYYSGMGIDRYGWDPKTRFDEIFYVHWSDYPLPKPWHIISKEDLSSVDWVLLNEWSNTVAPSLDLGLKLIDDLVTSSYIKCKQARGGIDDEFGKSVCLQSMIHWKKLYVDYWKAMNLV